MLMRIPARYRKLVYFVTAAFMVACIIVGIVDPDMLDRVVQGVAAGVAAFSSILALLNVTEDDEPKG